ncbi:MAG: hypothetical protein RMM53_13740, partial [Bacteroidia bacterium]|nr:hypothetical protein [Bacteroidia bacterium]
MRKFWAKIFGAAPAFAFGLATAQINIYNDGPIALDIRVKRCWSNQNFDITGLQYLLFGPNEYTYKLRFRDVENLDGTDWTAWKTVAADNQGYVWSPDDNQIVFSYVYSGSQAPTLFEFEYEAFRNRCGGRTDYNCCEIFGLCTGIYDANRRQGVGRVAFRAAEPNVWTIAQALSSDEQYAFQFEYRWRYTYALPALCPNPPYSDGPVTLNVWLDKIWADTDFDGFGFFGAEELNVQFRFKDNLEAAFPASYFCFTGSQGAPRFNNVNAEVLNRTYADLAANSFQFDFRVWEDDCP